MTVQATDVVTGTVNCMELADGKLVQLCGRIGQGEMSALRLALLSPLFNGCRDVVIDAGDVVAIDDEAIAVIAAAEEWATYAGARMLLSRATPVVEHALAELGFTDRIRRLSDLAGHERQPVLVAVPTVD